MQIVLVCIWQVRDLDSKKSSVLRVMLGAAVHKDLAVGYI